jgi:hypothetical protein
MTKADARIIANRALDAVIARGGAVTQCEPGPRRGLTAFTGRPIRRIAC